MLGITNHHLIEMMAVVKLGPHITDAQAEVARSLLEHHSTCFTDIPGKINITEYKINVKDEKFIRCQPYSLPCADKNDLKNEI